MRIEQARVRRGQRISASHHNGLVRLAEELTITQARVKGRHDPDGFSPHFDVRATVNVDHPFKVALSTDAGGKLTATFSPGFVAGIVPKIKDVALDDVDTQGNSPALIVGDDAFKKQGNAERGLLMFRYDLDHDSFEVTAVTPVAVPTPPASQPWTWYKLIAILTRVSGDVTVSQQCFFSQDFDVSEVRANGFFHAWPHTS